MCPHYGALSYRNAIENGCAGTNPSLSTNGNSSSDIHLPGYKGNISISSLMITRSNISIGSNQGALPDLNF
jgi:hypothetical protein